MKKIVYKVINKLGYRIERKIRDKRLIAPYLCKYDVKKFDKIYESKEYILALSNKYSDLNILENGDGFTVSFNSLVFYIESNEEFYILKEIFVDDDYQFDTSKKTIVIDIGANIGIASTYFSKQDFVEKVYSFEPVTVTYNQAIKNFELNNITNKVKIENFGLGDSDKKISFLFDSNSKGSSGLSAIKSDRYIGNENAIKVEVDIKNSKDELLSILNKHLDCQIIVKMDCEGGEIEILKTIDNVTDVFNKIDAFMIEWHDDSYDEVSKILLNNNFSFFTKNVRSQAGLILAFNNK